MGNFHERQRYMELSTEGAINKCISMIASKLRKIEFEEFPVKIKERFQPDRIVMCKVQKEEMALKVLEREEELKEYFIAQDWKTIDLQGRFWFKDQIGGHFYGKQDKKTGTIQLNTEAIMIHR